MNLEPTYISRCDMNKSIKLSYYEDQILFYIDTDAYK